MVTLLLLFYRYKFSRARFSVTADSQHHKKVKTRCLLPVQVTIADVNGSAEFTAATTLVGVVAAPQNRGKTEQKKKKKEEEEEKDKK